MKVGQRQSGVYLVIMAVLLVVLIAFGALAVDAGRLFVLRSEMQNAADAAALAAALELRGDAGSRTRAEAMARNLLQHNSRFASVQPLLGQNIGVDFFCAIGSGFDPDPIDEFCANPYVDGKSTAGSDREARYVRVRLEPSEGSEAYGVELFFLPVLRLLMENVSDRAFLNAMATAGRNFYGCNYPPVMLCNPFEAAGEDLWTEMSSGQQIILKQQGTTWAPGNFSFLQVDSRPGGGAPEVAAYLADQSLTGCTPPIVTTATGGMTNQTTSALNTRFDLYEPPAPFNRADAPDNFPPAPNVINYPRDLTWRAVDNRFGYGDWDRTAYWNAYHAWKDPGYPMPPGYASMTRYQLYQWEVAAGKLPSLNPLVTPGFDPADPAHDGVPDPDHLYTGEYPPPPSTIERRVFPVAVVNCLAHGINGVETLPLVNPDGFVKLFITESVERPPLADVYVEVVKWMDELDQEYHVDVQLFE